MDLVHRQEEIRKSMESVRLTGNSFTINSTANVVPLANTYGANAASGATCLYVYNSNTANGGVANLMLSNTQGTFVFGIPPGAILILNKGSTDTVNSAATGLIANPIQKTPD
jgi:hypothetical protein